MSITKKKKCIISRYDKSIKNPPYKTLPIDKVKVEKPINDNLGELFASILYDTCIEKGYKFKFYTTSDKKDFDYEIVVE